MKKACLKISLLIVALLGVAEGVMASNLPPCPSSGYFHNCFGTYTWADTGDKYVGEFRENQIHGKGTYVWKESGDKYVGEWKRGMKNGTGNYIFGPNSGSLGGSYFGKFLYAQKLPISKSSSGNPKLIKHKEFCEEIGFIPSSEKFDECVMVLVDTD